ncbi:MAG: hypothetical protein IPK03_01000 [Bacteroidetes bacterium]|nr:hypothetical protein [Bacteroidota bacterium]
MRNTLLKIVIYTLVLGLSFADANAQIRIGGTGSISSATVSSIFLDASSNPTLNGTIDQGKGLLFPRTNLVALTAVLAPGATLPNNFPTRLDGMIVYNSATGNAGMGGNHVYPGYYYYRNTTLTLNGGTWIRMADAGDTLTPLRISYFITNSIPIIDSITKVINNQLTNNLINGNNTTAGNGLISIVGGTGSALKNNSISVNTSALKDSVAIYVVQSPIKDSIISLVNVTLTANNGLTKSGINFELGGTLTKPTSINTSGANTIAVSGLQSGTVADSILVADATTGVMRRRSPATILAGSTTNTLSSSVNTMTSNVNSISSNAPIINSNSLTIVGNTITSNVNGVSSSSTLSNADSTTASNGLNLVGKDVRMGGALTGATSITTTGVNTLAISGLQSGTVADSILVADATSGVMRRRSPATILGASTTNNLSYSGNTLTSNVNGVSSAVNLFLADSTTASNGLNLVGKDVRMGGALTGATTITTTGANTLAISGLQSGTVADSILVADATTGVMRRRSPATILGASTTNNLSYSGNTLTSNVNGVSSAVNLFLADSTTASNGLNLVGKDVRMGGALTSATTITTTGVNTLAVTGLQSGTVADSILVADATSGVMRRRSPATILGASTTNNLSYSGNTLTSNVNGVSSAVNLFLADSTTASNGLNLVGKDVRMGGALTSATTITTTGVNTLAVSGLQSGTVADSILVADATTGVMRRRSPATILGGSTTNTISSSVNTMTSNVNGISSNTPIINSNSLTIVGNTITSNVNGVSSSSTLSNADSTTASNGLNLVGKDVRMGGALTGATSITTTGVNTLAISGLQSGTVADSILVADATSGVMRRRSPATILGGSTTNTLTITGNTITSNVNGVSSSSTLSNADSTTASNGLNLVGKDVRMGGALTGATTITTTGANTLAISGLQSGTVADSILVADATSGVMRRRSPATILGGSTTNTISSSVNTMTSNVNGISSNTPIINSNSLTIVGNTITSNVNGVSSSSTLSNAD